MRPRHGRRISAALGLVLGGGAMVVLLATLNRPPPEKKDKLAEAAVGFEVPPEPPPKPKPQRKPKPKPRKTTNTPPAPALAASLSGLALGLDAGGADVLGDLSDSLLGDTSNVVMTEDSVDSIPQRHAGVARPSYPSRARNQGITGFVTVRILVGADGGVADVAVVDAQPRGVFEESTLDAVRQWTFEPATYHGAAVRSWVQQRIPFQLEAAG